MWKIARPRVGDILTRRQERSDDELQKAETLRNDAAEVLAAYERAVADGRARAQTILRETSERLAKESAAQQAALARRGPVGRLVGGGGLRDDLGHLGPRRGHPAEGSASRSVVREVPSRAVATWR